MNASLRKTLMLVAVGGLMAMAGACGSSSNKGGTGGSPGVGGMTGGVGGSPGGNALSRFTGTWHPSSGTVTFLCSGVNDTQPVTDNLTWGAGVGADLVQTSGSCVFKANVTASTASALPSQSCTAMEGTTTLTISFSAYTFSLGADGLTATESASGTATLIDSGVTAVCSYSETASYQKIAN